jgi:hypothetical protein
VVAPAPPPAPVAQAVPPPSDELILTPEARDVDRGGGKRVAGIVTGAAGVALVSGGVFFGLRAKSAADDISDLSRMGGTWSPRHEQIEQDGRRDSKLSTICLVAGGAAVATGVVLYVLGANDRGPAEAPLAVAPVAGGAAVVMTWSR